MHRHDEPDGFPADEVTQGIMASTGLEWTRWSSPSFGWSFRFLVGATLPVVQDHNRYWNDFFGDGSDLRYTVDLTFEVGLAF